jgi:DNA-binding sugar fermentation-stimulating protein
MKPVRDKIIDNYEWYSSIKNEPIWGKAWNQVFDLIYNQINIEVKSRILDKIRGI